MMSRFVVASVTGYTPNATSTHNRPRTSYSVLDTAYNYREVAKFYAVIGSNRLDAVRLQKATAECDRLNEWAATA